MDLLEKARQKLEEQKRIPQKVVELPPVKKIIEKKIIEEEIQEKIKVDRKKGKTQLLENMIRILKKDLQQPKHKQKFPIEYYRNNELFLRTLEKR